MYRVLNRDLRLCGKVGVAVALIVVACRAHESKPTPSPAPPPSEFAPLHSRAELVEQADRMASEASRAPRARSAELLSRAADLRTKLFRNEHRTVDALESIELLKLRERSEPGACEARLRRVLLESELARDPTQAYRAIYAAHVTESNAECRSAEERALSVLGAYRPPPNALAEIEANVARERTSEPLAQLQPPPVSSATGAGDSRPAEPARITRIERYGADDAARVVVFVTRPTRFELGELNVAGERPRVFVDIAQAELATKSSYAVGGLVERVRVGARTAGSRVVLDLNEAASQRAFYLPEPYRLVIDVVKHSAAEPSLASGKRRVQRVVLDPGHGGHDPGALGPSGLREKDVVLDIAHRAAPLIARELGISALLTRDADQFVPLDERAARANAFHADVFISIHCNASEDGLANGVMSFVLDSGHEELAEHIAARENAASSAAAVEVENAVSHLIDPASRAASAKFAELLQRAALASLAEGYPDVANGGVKRAGFYVLAGARMPAVLFETSFISNPAGEARLNTATYRQRMADAIVNALRAYREGR